MTPLHPIFHRHALRAVLALAGACALLFSPPALSDGMPGPGLWARLTGAGLLLCAVLFPGPGQKPAHAPAAVRPCLGLVLSSLLWIMLLLPAGWMAATLLSGFCAMKSAGCSLKESLLIPALLCLVLEAGMVHLLQWPMPEGFLWTMLSGA